MVIFDVGWFGGKRAGGVLVHLYYNNTIVINDDHHHQEHHHHLDKELVDDIQLFTDCLDNEGIHWACCHALHATIDDHDDEADGMI